MTKAETLMALKNILTLSVVPELIYFSVREWNIQKKEILRKIKKTFNNDIVIIRSSRLGEDSDTFSQAGCFHSVPNVNANDKNKLEESIGKVIESYAKNGSLITGVDLVIVQHMVRNVSMSGVLFTQDLNTGAPYYVINYDDQSGRTDTVTAGNEYSNRTLFVSRIAVEKLHSQRFKKLLQAVEEVEAKTGLDTLDIEFALDNEENVYLLQARPISTKANWNREITMRINDAILRIQDFVKSRTRPLPNIYGTRSIFGQMPDWNPAEIIGNSPRPLAFSLHRHLISDKSWRIARKKMGYAEPMGAHLISSLGGKPYVDVRFSFHSFLPADLEEKIGAKLVNAWVERLSKNRELHDKIEFEIAMTAYFPGIDEDLNSFYSGILTQKERKTYLNTLFNFTDRLITEKVSPITGELKKIERLKEIRKNLVYEESKSDILTVSALIENCIEFGTIPFAILARHGFIASGFLRVLQKMGALDENEISLFQRSIKTIAGEFLDDLHKLTGEKKKQGKFLEKYGHLRPGTYDILSLRYDQRDQIIKPESRHKPFSGEKFKLSKKTNEAITKILKKSGFKISASRLLSYIKQATIAREYSKFVFTHVLSDVLEILALWGENHGLNREEISFLTIQTILNSGTVSEGRTLESYLREKSKKGKEEHQITLALHLPHIIDDPNDVAIAPLLLSRPNFITQKTVRGRLLKIDGNFEEAQLLDNQILLIEGADPGYDWIFSRPIAGLITKYGGANSHMAIRCAEFGIPAAIGCGEQIFDRLEKSVGVDLNCSEQRVAPIEN